MTRAVDQTERVRSVAEPPARILIVDDEQYMCVVCTRTLQRGGYDVIATSDPDEAVDLLRGEASFDLLLTDIKMPTMSGLDLARIARERDPAIAIIIMTGFASVDHLHQSVQRGVADFLSKPFELDHLRLAVDQALHKRSLLQDNLRLRAMEKLLASSEMLSTTLELNELGQIIMDVMIEQSQCRAAFLIVRNESQPSALQVNASAPEAVLCAAGEALAAEVFELQQPRAAADQLVAEQEGSELRYGFAAPLRAQGEVNGVLLLADDRIRALRPGVEESILLLANHAGAALRNAYLYNEIELSYQRLQELDRLKSEFLSIASHELRTPLSIVLGYTMMVVDQTNGEPREYLGRVMEGAQRIKEVVDDMISLRHLETGEEQLALEPQVVQELVAQIVSSMDALIASQSHQVVVDAPEQPIVIESDREKLQLVMNHLLSNAIKFSAPGGHVQISIGLATSAEIVSGDTYVLPAAPEPDSATRWVVVSFRDTGIGIPEREQRRIFDRFYQVSRSLTRERGGIGLGLSLVRDLVTSLGGLIWVASQEGVGSTFSVALPYSDTLLSPATS
jgi:signal transduction histidine kinase